MSVHTRPQSHLPGPERDEREPAPDERLVPRTRTRTMILIGIGALGVFLILLAVGVVPRLRTHRELSMAAQKAREASPQVYVVRPEPAAGADLSPAAPTHDLQGAHIHPSTCGVI